MTDAKPYNPLDRRNLGASVAEALLEKLPSPLGEIVPFEGAGIYAIYYTGQFAAYAEITARNAQGRFEMPIYVGKAVPPGARTGAFGLDSPPGRALFNRLREHGGSVQEAQNLNLADFHCRFLVVDDIWIPLGESLLVAKFSPLWNHLVDGFGNHDPGSGRYNQFRSRWDTLHPGRTWALRCRERGETAQQIEREVRNFLESVQVPAKPVFHEGSDDPSSR